MEKDKWRLDKLKPDEARLLNIYRRLSAENKKSLVDKIKGLARSAAFVLVAQFYFANL